jgi:alpha-1,3-rhamnosyl/mannosyltransferase
LNIKKSVKIYIDGEVLILDHFSGIGHYTLELLRAVDELLYDDAYSHIRLEIGVPRKYVHRLGKYGFENFGVRKTPFRPHVINGLKARGRLPWIDLFFGKRVYVFPNYSSWPTLFSPVVPVIYDLSFIFHREYGDPKNMEFLVDQVKKSVQRSKRIITISTNSKNEIVDYYSYNEADIDIIYPIIETRSFYPRSQSEIKKVKAKYGIFDNYILFIGNLEPRKNLMGLLNAYELLPRELQKRYSLLLVGAKGWQDGEIHKKIQDMRMRSLKVIQPVDYVVDDDRPALISGASVFAYVSHYEGFGIPPVEALACGVPTVTSYNSSLPEAVGNLGYHVDDKSPDDIAKALEKALKSSDRKELTDKGYKHALKFNAHDEAVKFIHTAEKAWLGK